MKTSTAIGLGVAALGLATVGAGVFLRKRVGKPVITNPEVAQPLDSTRQLAKAWLIEHGGKITVDDAFRYASAIREDFVPSVLAEWQRHGMSVAFVRELAERFSRTSAEPVDVEPETAT